MKIAVVAEYDVTNVKYWSGLGYYFFELLKKHYELTPIELSFKRPVSSMVKGFYFNRIVKKKYFAKFDLSVHRFNRKLFSKSFGEEYDVIVTFDYFLIPLISRYAKRTILISDATFDNLLNYYDYRTNLCELNIEDGHALQRDALAKAAYSLFSSNWAASNATARYGAEPTRMKILLFGSNLSNALDVPSLANVITKRIEDTNIKLFFPALSWDRKGGDYAIKVVEKLNKSGIKAKLIIAGCSIPDHLDQRHIVNIGFLDKRKQDQEAKLIDYYKRSHFLILPSKADCTPVVFSEANSFALPVITSKTGGIETIVNPENNNGVAFELDDGYVNNVVKYIVDMLDNEEQYAETCTSSFAIYNDKLAWSNAEEVLISVINSLS